MRSVARGVMASVASLVVAMTTPLSAHAEGPGGFKTYADRAQFGIPAFAGLVAALKGDGEGLALLAGEYFSTAVSTQGLKLAFNSTHFGVRPGNGGDMSFPSGHTSSAFAGAAFLQSRYGWRWGLPSFAAAAAVGFSRMNSEDHHLRDVIASAALAYGIAYRFEGRAPGEGATLVPLVDPVEGSVGGVMVQVRF